MSLTTEETLVLKTIAVEKIKADAVDSINSVAMGKIKIKTDEIKVIDDKRNADIQALEK